MKEGSKVPYVVAASVLALLIGGIVGQQVWKWYDGPRRTSTTRKALDELSNGFHKHDQHVMDQFHRGRYTDGWWNDIKKETNGDTMVFRSAGPDKEFNTEDDITITTSVPRLPEKKKRSFFGFGR